MKALRKTPVIQHHPDILEQVRKMYDLDKPGRMEESIDTLQEWIKKQPHFNKKDFDRDYLELFIIRARGSLERAKKRLENTFTLRTIHSQLYEPIRANSLENLETIDEALLPKQTDDFCTIYMVRTREKKYEENFLPTYYKRVINMIEYCYQYDYNAGVIAILDYRETDNVKLISAMTHPYVRLSLVIVSKALGLRAKGIHILASSRLMEAIVLLTKPFMRDQESRVFFHRTCESLYDYVDKDLLPAEYGGKEKPLAELAKEQLDFFSSDELFNQLKELQNATIDTTIKPVESQFDPDLGIPGSFRKLNVD